MRGRAYPNGESCHTRGNSRPSGTAVLGLYGGCACFFFKQRHHLALFGMTSRGFLAVDEIIPNNYLETTAARGYEQQLFNHRRVLR